LSLQNEIREAINSGKLSGRLWLYSNYHCNLACRYCLTESAPQVPIRELGQETMIDYAKQAKELGFTGIGITGGEPFLLGYIVSVISEIADFLPVTILTNGTLFNNRRIQELNILKGKDVRFQISLDSPDPENNDKMRGPNNFAKVIAAVPKLTSMGLHIRIATTVENQPEEEQERLRDLVASMKISPEDHIIRKIVARGRASTEGLGVQAPIDKLCPELTITTAGAFWSPFAPTIINGKTQKDLLISRTIQPLSKPTKMLLDFIGMVPQSTEDVEGFV
jgi:MoaA/NifB/PqqE/SkfB family radical SAM enzyme